MLRRTLSIAALAAAGAVVGPVWGADAATAPVTFAVIGDTPYAASEVNGFPALASSINGSSGVDFVLHAGDVKDASTECTDQLFNGRRSLFQLFSDPFVLTPGDNDWTDCHQVDEGSYVPTERLDAIRRIFYPTPGVTMGQNPMTVATQADTSQYSDYRENVRFSRGGVVFASVNVVGSANDRVKWSGLPGGDMPAVRKAEYQARDAADVAWIDQTFQQAKSSGAAGVLLLMQAEPKDTNPFSAVRSAILSNTRSFDGQVLLLHGDGHVYTVTNSYAGVGNLTRLETFGETAGKWIRMTVDSSTSKVFSWTVQNVSDSSPTPSPSGPTVTSTTPADGATGFGRWANVKAKFSEAVSGVDGSTFTLARTDDGAPVPAAVSYDSSKHLAVLNPDKGLAAGTEYTATLTSGIHDGSGNALSMTRWSFTTKGTSTTAPTSPTSGPTVTSVTPQDGATGVGRWHNATAKFSAAVTGVSGSTFTLKEASSGALVPAAVSYLSSKHKAVLNPDTGLAKGTKYTATLTGGIKGTDGTSIAPKSWSFTTVG